MDQKSAGTISVVPSSSEGVEVAQPSDYSGGCEVGLWFTAVLTRPVLVGCLRSASMLPFVKMPAGGLIREFTSLGISKGTPFPTCPPLF